MATSSSALYKSLIDFSRDEFPDCIEERHPVKKAVLEIALRLKEPHQTDEDIKNAVLQHFASSKCWITQSIDGLNSGYALTDELLRKIATYYKEKYGIEIIITSLAELTTTLKERVLSDKVGPVGLILTIGVEGFHHVTPVVINLDAERKICQALLLDSAKESKDEYAGIAKYFTDCGFEVFCSKGVRQADNFSCRTESTVILRNALLDTKHKKIKDLRDVFLSSEDKMVELPLEWDYIDQISHKGRSLEGALVSREHFSSKVEKREHPRTVCEFRERYSIESAKVKRYSILLPKWLNAFSEERLSSETTIWVLGREQDRYIIVDERKISKYNIYLYAKALRNIEKFGGPRLENPKITEWRARYSSS